MSCVCHWLVIGPGQVWRAEVVGLQEYLFLHTALCQALHQWLPDRKIQTHKVQLLLMPDFIIRDLLSVAVISAES